MPKIKNWSKADVETTGVKHQWVNDETSSNLRVVIHPTYVHGGINRPDDPYAIKVNGDFKTGWDYSTVDEAREAAVKWMKNHPNT